MCIQMYAWYVTSYTFIYVIINALRRFMFPGAGTPLALPYQEFTKGGEAPLSSTGGEGPDIPAKGQRIPEVPPMKRKDMCGCGKLRTPRKIPHEKE